MIRFQKVQYIPEIDALRCLAVMMVFFFHERLLPIGWAGVWIFFVISGFSITCSLLNTDSEDFSKLTKLKNFYVRRSLRIWPLYFGYIIACILFLIAIKSSENENRLYYIATFTYNYLYAFSLDVGYYGRLFSHLWTLAAEEQFYLIYPILFLIFSRKNLKYLLFLFLFVAPIFRFIMSLWGINHGYNNLGAWRLAYYASPAHIDAFSVGCLLALYKTELLKRPTYSVYIYAFTIVTALLYLSFYAWADHHFGGMKIGPAIKNVLTGLVYGEGREVVGYSVLSCIGAALVVSALKTDGRGVFDRAWRSFLQNSWAQEIGKISFGIYMFHPAALMVIWGFFHENMDGLGDRPIALRAVVMVLSVPVALSCAYLSFRFFERPVLKLKERFR